MLGFTRWPRPLTPRRRRALAAEIEEELRLHLALRAADNEREGMDADEARSDAAARFGDVGRIHDACMKAEDDHPLRVAGRLVSRGVPLALGLGAFAFAFVFVQVVLLQPLRFTDADRLVRLGAGWHDATTSFAEFEAWRAESSSFERLTAFNARPLVISGEGEPVTLRTMMIGEGYFEVFDVVPTLGRTFRADEVEATPAPVVLVSEQLWTERYDRDSSLLEHRLVLDGVPHTVVGVMPADGQLSHVVDVWTPLGAQGGRMPSYVVGRLHEGHTLDDARADLAAISARLAAIHPEGAQTRTALHPLRDLYAEPVRPLVVRLLVGAAGVLLLVWGFVFWRVLRRSAIGHIGGADPWREALAVAGGAAVVGLALAAGAQAFAYEILLGQWGPLFDAPGLSVLGVVGLLALASAAGMVGSARHAHRTRRNAVD